MKLKEIFTLTRPNTSVPFHDSSSIFFANPETNFTTSSAHQHFIDNYVNLGKCELTTPSLSDDGLTVTHTTIFVSEEAMQDLYSDNFFLEGLAARTEYWNNNKIAIVIDVVPVTE